MSDALTQAVATAEPIATIYTTLNRIRAHQPCEDGWRKLLAGLGKTEADNEPLPYARIVEISGIDDALWACRAEPQYAKEWRLFAVWCARQVEHLMQDERSKRACDVAERYALGQATDDELAAASAAAWAAWDAARAASAAARAASAAARAASAAAWDAASAAAWDAWDAAWAASAAARAASAAARAASAAAWDAAWAAAWDAAWAASAAARAAAWDAETKKLLEIVGGCSARVVARREGR
jgi:hypothetical protein